MMRRHGLSRRDFLQRVGGGIAVLVAVGPIGALAQAGPQLYPQDFNAYLAIGTNGRVTVYSGKIEMGQGAMTSQAQMVAEELGVDIASIDMVLGDTDRCPWDMGTFGSMTSRVFGPVIRAAAAKARQTLTTMAAARLGVPAQRLQVHAGIVSVLGQPGRSVRYAELSQGARIVELVDAPAALRTQSEFNVMGVSVQRLDAIDKVTGRSKYAADVRLPGMQYARILRAPMHGARMASLDTTGASQLPGVTVVHRDDLVAVLHAEPQAATAALGRLNAQWQLPTPTSGGALDPQSIGAHLVANAGAAKDVLQRGDVDGARADATHLFEATYEKGYVAHAPLETHAALAQWQAGRMTVWASTQTPFPTRERIAKALGLDAAKVRVITPLVGGGFGGKSADAQAIEAARLAQITGRPVQVAWTREEEFYNDTFDPASVVKVVSAIDPGATITLWDYAVYAAGERGATPSYRLANARIRSAGRPGYGDQPAGTGVHPFAVGSWRGPGANMNVYAIESQVDLMASAAGMDALAFRLHNLDDERMRAVLQAAASAFGWTPANAPGSRAPGHGFGLACVIDAGSYVATMAEVHVDPASGQIQVLRITCAQDMGVVINPQGARQQIEGGLTMGLGYALSEELRFRDGEILDRNFDTYEIPRLGAVPRVQVVLVDNGTLAPQGAGEPAITTTGAVLANAVFDATGVRLYRLPMLAERVRVAIQTRAAARHPDAPAAPGHG